jgi:ATP-dependent Clp protease, protease subunit
VKSKFWNWIKNEADDDGNATRTLHMDGVIAAETWWGDEVTPALFRNDLFAENGDITIWLNSPGGDCIAASQIYSMLMDYPHQVTVKIDGIAASAASVIAMAGTKVLMAPTALMMVHNPLTVAIGDSAEMQKAIAMLGEVKESIINAYQLRTNQSRTKISHLMDAETWMNANKAIELGFADGILTDSKSREPGAPVAENFAFSRRAVTNSLLDRLGMPAAAASSCKPPEPPPAESPVGVTAESLEKRLFLIAHK